LFAALYDDKSLDNVSNVVNVTMPKSATIEPTLGQQPPHHEFKVPKPEPSSENVALPITFVPQEQLLGNGQDVPQGQPMGDGQDSSKRPRKSSRRKNKKCPSLTMYKGPEAILNLAQDTFGPCSGHGLALGPCAPI